MHSWAGSGDDILTFFLIGRREGCVCFMDLIIIRVYMQLRVNGMLSTLTVICTVSQSVRAEIGYIDPLPDNYRLVHCSYDPNC